MYCQAWRRKSRLFSIVNGQRPEERRCCAGPGCRIRPKPATLTISSILLQNLILQWIAEDGFPTTIWQMLLPSSRATRSARCKISARVLVTIDVEKVSGVDPSCVGG